MIRIVICDDEKVFLEKIKESTKQFFYNRKIDTVIQSFQNSNGLISDIKNKTDLFLLDIMMPGNSGLELASIIRDIQPDAYIIFISNMEDAVFTSFKYAPLRFIRKEYINEELSEALSAFLSDYYTPENIIEVNDGKKVIALPVKSINFAESNKHYIQIYTDSGCYSVRGKLSDYVEIFSYENIVHINQSYMVNLNYVKSYDSVSVLLENNFKINIGRKYKEEFKSAFFRYQRKYYHANFLWNNWNTRMLSIIFLYPFCNKHFFQI